MCNNTCSTNCGSNSIRGCYFSKSCFCLSSIGPRTCSIIKPLATCSWNGVKCNSSQSSERTCLCKICQLSVIIRCKNCRRFCSFCFCRRIGKFWNCKCGKNTDNNDNDHKFDKCKTFIFNANHFESP